jgi:hypothetical protein
MRPHEILDGLETLAIVAFCLLVCLGFVVVAAYLLISAALAIAG